MREQMIAHLTVEVVKAVGMGEGALPEVVELEAVEVEVEAVVGVGVVESVTATD
jgi:hypothetical protein